MSGIVGIVNTNGAPVDRELLRRMTTFLAFRGPDAQEVWIQDHVGFGKRCQTLGIWREHRRRAEMQMMSCGVGYFAPVCAPNSAPNACQLRRYALSSIAFIGLPCPRNSTGIRGDFLSVLIMARLAADAVTEEAMEDMMARCR